MNEVITPDMIAVLSEMTQGVFGVSKRIVSCLKLFSRTFPCPRHVFGAIDKWGTEQKIVKK